MFETNVTKALHICLRRAHDYSTGFCCQPRTEWTCTWISGGDFKSSARVGSTEHRVLVLNTGSHDMPVDGQFQLLL